MKDNLMTLRTTRVGMGVIIMAISLVMSACSGGGAKATDVKITAPTSGTAINVGQGTVIQGAANGDNITRVEVVVDGKAYASLSTPDKTQGVANFPVNLPWTPMAAGTHAIQLRAYGIGDKLLGQSEPLVLDAKATVAQVTPTTAATKVVVATNTPSSLAAVVTPTVAAQATSSATGPSMTVTNDFVNVRSGPATGYQLLGTLDKGQSAPVRGKSSDGNWWQISYAAGSNGVGWVFGQYVQANSASDSVAIASAPPLPTSPPQPTTPVQIVPIATAIPPTAIVQSQPLVGVKGQLHVDQNPIAAGGTVNAYWNVSNIQGIWFDKGDGNGYQAAGGSQSVAIGGLNNARLLQLKWRDSSGVDNVDSLTVAISGQAVATVAATNNCSPSDPNWRGSNPNYPFCVTSDMDWADSADSIRWVSQSDTTITAQWNIYGIAGIWLSVQPNGQQCGQASSGGFEVAVQGNGS
ncbi:MAG TPA: SH3 domain-containing protein, partial [Anaerolineae bacterium]